MPGRTDVVDLEARDEKTSSVSAPERRRTVVKLAASMAGSSRARRHRIELAANAVRASIVQRAVRLGVGALFIEVAASFGAEQMLSEVDPAGQQHSRVYRNHRVHVRLVDLLTLVKDETGA